MYSLEWQTVATCAR